MSIEAGGYAERLAQRVRGELGIAHVNLSVGDQTSLMGCMRVLSRLREFAPGDIVVWEYSLLDTLLTIRQFAPDDVRDARRLAWDRLLERGADIIVLLVPSKRHTARRSRCEREIADDARALGLRLVDLRDLASRRGIGDPAAHYRDDRHPHVDSPLVDAIVTELFDEIARGLARAATGDARQHLCDGIRWQWQDAAMLAPAEQDRIETFRNSLLAVDALTLAPGQRADARLDGCVVAVGVVATHASGGLWCGHVGCQPISTRLPEGLPYDFLLRSLVLPCTHDDATTARLACAPAAAFANGLWPAYGHANRREPGEIAVFGVLVDVGSRGKRPPHHSGWGATLLRRLKAAPARVRRLGR